ncbi:hypothetical protein D3C71_1647540 [compost metagenome]
MATHQSRTKRQEVPFGASRLQYFKCVNPESVKDEAEFIHQRNIHIPLRVLNHFGSFGHLDATGLVSAGGDDLPVQLVYNLGDFQRAATSHLLDVGQAVLLVAGINALRAVTAEEIDIEFLATEFLQHRHAHFLRRTGIDR